MRVLKEELVCKHCGKTFLRESHQTKYNLSKGKIINSFCNKECVRFGKANFDEFTGFRELLRSCKRRFQIKDNDLTLEQMKAQWEKQKGICTYTKVSLELYTDHRRHRNSSLYRASLDRMDNSKGYTADNIHFISIMANYAKNRGSHEQMIEFCKIIALNYKDL